VINAMTIPTRRIILQGIAGATAVLAQGFSASPALSETDAMEKAMRAFTNNAQPKTGQIKLDIAPLVENGNSVAVAVDVESPMTAASYVKRVAIFSEKNPQPEVFISRPEMARRKLPHAFALRQPNIWPQLRN
jgi:sulfur-oxidizing protein SoxY